MGRPDSERGGVRPLVDERPAGPAPALTVVIPAYNEEANVEACHRELVGVLDAHGAPFEILFVDDGSTDGTAAALRRLAKADPRVRLLRLRQNAGQSAALDAGFRAARGAIVVTMDADLQNDPHDIPKLLAALPGHDAVCGWRVDRQDPWTKRVASRVANRVRDRVTRDGVHDTGCSLKVFRREALGRLRLYRGMHRFLPALLQMEGLLVAEVPVSHRPRRAGVSKYGNWQRLWTGLADLWAVRWMARRRLRYEVEEEEP
jgi:glycosyltransferase involved in cell wall biosynthesis